MRRLSCLALLLLLAAPAVAAPAGVVTPNDDQARRLIVGDWIAAPGPQAARDALYRALARYNPDGTGQVQVFHDAACSKLALTRDFRWAIEGGRVVTTVSDGRRIAVQIVSLDAQSMILRLDGRLEHRIRATTCSREMAV